MKIMISFLSAAIIFFGIIPFFGEGFIIPNTGIGYSFVLICLGALLIIFSIANGLLMGLEKAFLIFQGLGLALVGAVPLLPAVLPFALTYGVILSFIVMRYTNKLLIILLYILL